MGILGERLGLSAVFVALGVVSLGGLAKTEIAYGVDLKWLKETVDRLMKAGKTQMSFIVKEQDEKGNLGYIIPPSEYRLFIDGYDTRGGLAIAEDFPPILWPQD
jgi:hypothetical protein